MIEEWWNIPELIEVRENFFLPEKRLFDLDNLIPSNGDRKVEYNLRTPRSLPSALDEAVQFVCDETKTLYTTAILKYYYPGKDSWAYKKHKDPKRFMNGPLFLCTLRWEAIFSVWDQKWVKYDYEAIPNNMMLVNPKLDHQVSRPQTSEYRSLLFLGVE